VTRAEFIEGWELFGGRTEVPTKRFVTRVQMIEMAKVTSTIVALAAFLAGATYAGADWATRVVHGLLLWEGHRTERGCCSPSSWCSSPRWPWRRYSVSSWRMGSGSSPACSAAPCREWTPNGGLGRRVPWLGVGESLLIVWKPRLEPFSVRGAANTFLDSGRTFIFRAADGSADKLHVGLAASAGILTVYGMLCLSATVLSFTRRDVV
jgi:hypothetical protein